MTRPVIVCTCHGLQAPAFERACAAGAHNVKTCFQQLGCLPQCGGCAPEVRKMLGAHASRQPAGAMIVAPIQPKPS